MEKVKVLILILFCVYCCGCFSVPRAADYKELYSFTQKEEKLKGGLGGTGTIVTIKDFRENERYDEEVAALKEEVEKYITSHADLTERAKNNLRELKVTAGATKEEVNLLLGKPDKVIKNETDAASEIWIYQTGKNSAFTIIVIPVFFTHDGYYLYFENNILTKIERHYLQQTFEASGIGLQQQKK